MEERKGEDNKELIYKVDAATWIDTPPIRLVKGWTHRLLPRDG